MKFRLDLAVLRPISAVFASRKKGWYWVVR